HLDLKLSRAKFDDLTHGLVERCRQPVMNALADAKLTEKDIDEVILVGGSTRTPAVQKLVRELMGGRAPNQSVNPDEAVALGAAIQAGVLAGEVKDVVLLDITPLSLGVETMGGVVTKIVERNTTIPVRRSQIFSTAEDNQPAVDINVLQGERELAKDNRSLGKFKLDGIAPAPRGIPQIEVAFDIDANGILKVSAMDKTTNKEQTVTISGSTSLEKAEIDKMVRDAQEHAAEDKKRRQEVDVRNSTDATVYQIQRQLNESGDKLRINDKSRLEQLVAETKKALEENAPIERLRELTSDLTQAANAFNASDEANQQENDSQTSQNKTEPPDDVIDTEFTEK
ncbi:MAG TPA: molecular chaperone DnaK, partial [Peptococcaceae bacterium]|nr:molecular chaperone DnaK [Peptococcaceae bacterium]